MKNQKFDKWKFQTLSLEEPTIKKLHDEIVRKHGAVSRLFEISVGLKEPTEIELIHIENCILCKRDYEKLKKDLK